MSFQTSWFDKLCHWVKKMSRNAEKVISLVAAPTVAGLLFFGTTDGILARFCFPSAH